MIELLLGSLGLFTIARGISLVVGRAENASPWLAAGAGLSLVCAAAFPMRLGFGGAFILGVGVSVAAGLVLVEQLYRRERQQYLRQADDAEVGRVMRDARLHRLERRQRAKRGAAAPWPAVVGRRAIG